MLQDYKAYMRMRKTLLQGPVGRAALLEGGIVWRLAWDACTIEETAAGPEVDNEYAHSRIHKTNVGGRTCLETTLTTQDKYVIVGVYRVLLGAERDASILSWWPTDDSWAVSGFASGYWSHDAEEWFQRRVRLIKEGKATPMTQRDWKRSLRHTFSDSHKFIAGVETLSADRT
ncbi:hypothetical protein BC629DRAFT_1300221 [Irpex lacteus]|nr:hypothetical protein BC629DRAFT_1300221 [Irpex lacteus]